MGPESAKTFPGQVLLQISGQAAGRAKQVIEYGRRGKGYIFGAFRPATGEAFTRPYLSRSTACWVAFLEEVELWLPAESERVYAILDNLSAHRAADGWAPRRGVGGRARSLRRSAARGRWPEAAIVGLR